MIRVLVADDHPAVRVGLERLLRGEPGLVHAGSASTAAEALEEAAHVTPDCVLLDYQLPGGGLGVCWRLKSSEPSPGVIVYSAFAGDGLAVAALLARADCMLDKAAPADAIFESIRLVTRRTRMIEPPREALVRAGEGLDADDLPIFGMLAEGTPPSDIAATLKLDPLEFEERVGNVLARVERRLGLSVP